VAYRAGISCSRRNLRCHLINASDKRRPPLDNANARNWNSQRDIKIKHTDRYLHSPPVQWVHRAARDHVLMMSKRIRSRGVATSRDCSVCLISQRAHPPLWNSGPVPHTRACLFLCHDLNGICSAFIYICALCITWKSYTARLILLCFDTLRDWFIEGRDSSLMRSPTLMIHCSLFALIYPTDI
jgi:hypothetical protein